MNLRGYQIVNESLHPSDTPIIMFPENEIVEIKRNIAETGSVSTLRTDQEFGKYRLNETVLAPQINMLLKVVGIKRLSSYKEYEYVDYLSKDQSEYLKKQKKIEQVKLKKV